MLTNSSMPPWAIRPITPEEVYTDRAEHLEYLYESGLKAITRRTMSMVQLGQRRMGKTEIFKRVVNRLFFEQDGYDDFHASVVPVYFSFEDRITDLRDFAEDYVENFIRWYTGFRLKLPQVLSRRSVDSHDLRNFVERRIKVSAAFQEALDLYDAIHLNKVNLPEKRAILLPRTVSDWENSTIVMFLDEFQYTRLPQYDFDIVGLMQEAVESPTCPHFVTGSAMSILAGEILGRGALFGRFRSRPIKPLTEYWGSELVLRCARYYHADVTEDMAPVVAARCGGNPFYITAVVQQSVEQNKPLLTEERINEILAWTCPRGSSGGN